MKHYKMASISNPSITKQPLKLIEVPLSKFSEEVIPYHERLLEQQKANLQRLIQLNHADEIKKEIREEKKFIKQVRDLMYELDTLRTQVENTDLNSFDTKTMPLRNSLLKLIRGYQDLEKMAEKYGSQQKYSEAERINPFEGVSQIQLQENLGDLKLQHTQDQLNRVQEIQKDTENLHEIYQDLHSMVHAQGEQATQVEENVTSAQENVSTGLRSLLEANKLKSAAYPATGAVLGTLVGGPIGLVAGLKVGGIAAVGCALAGYTGGFFLRKHKDTMENESDEAVNNENNENQTVTETLKKDI